MYRLRRANCEVGKVVCKPTGLTKVALPPGVT